MQKANCPWHERTDAPELPDGLCGPRRDGDRAGEVREPHPDEVAQHPARRDAPLDERHLHQVVPGEELRADEDDEDEPHREDGSRHEAREAVVRDAVRRHVARCGAERDARAGEEAEREHLAEG